MKRKWIFIGFVALIEIILCFFGLKLLLSGNQNIGGVILLVFAFIVLIYVVGNYNKIIRYKNKIKESLALVDIQLKLRFDLIPNLVKVVKKYASHEKELFSEIVKLRNQAVKSTDEKEKLEYANKLVPQMKNIIAVAEGYPELKSSVLFKNLMEQLTDVEDRLVSARRIYDSNVNLFNTTIEVFPINILSAIFGFKREELFKIDAGESIVINVKEDLKWYQKKSLFKDAMR